MTQLEISGLLITTWLIGLMTGIGVMVLIKQVKEQAKKQNKIETKLENFESEPG